MLNAHGPRARSGDLVLFGATGDLAQRKLLPALYELDRTGRLHADNRILCASRSKLSREEYLQRVRPSLDCYVPSNEFTQEVWERFAARINYVSIDAESGTGFDVLAEILKHAPGRDRIYYCSTSPSLFCDIAEALKKYDLVEPSSRIVLEKPLGTDLASSRAINERIGAIFAESQVFRIDHYLDKETVQNLLVLRFANSLFEPLWNSQHIDHVQITLAEEVGIEGRWDYYDDAGALRDMIQNHMLQLLCLVAMEPPAHFEQDSVRDEKVKVLRALRSMTEDCIDRDTVRGQYSAGAVANGCVPAYLDEPDGKRQSSTETFVAIKAHIDNWRWSGVPFYLRTGKRLPERTAEIVIQFKRVPHPLFPLGSGGDNRLILQLQPGEGIKLILNSKRPGPGQIRLQPVPLDLNFADTFGDISLEAYERLLADVLDGNSTLFVRRDEIELAWTWVDQIRTQWSMLGKRPHRYPAGTWGPTSAIALIERDGRTWHEDVD